MRIFWRVYYLTSSASEPILQIYLNMIEAAETGINEFMNSLEGEEDV